jgi:hypothetical protein
MVERMEVPLLKPAIPVPWAGTHLIDALSPEIVRDG